MDRAVLLKHLVQAENVVLLGQLHVQRQRQIVAELERNGQDSSRSRNLLGLFEEMLAMHHERCALLRDRLASARPDCPHLAAVLISHSLSPPQE